MTDAKLLAKVAREPSAQHGSAGLAHSWVCTVVTNPIVRWPPPGGEKFLCSKDGTFTRYPSKALA